MYRLTVFLSMVFLGCPLSVAAEQTEPTLFLYNISESHSDYTYSPLKEKGAVYQLPNDQSLTFDYSEPCDIKCGLSQTGMIMLQIVVEAKADQLHRYSLMDPNYEP